MKKPTQQWVFRPRFHANVFGWKASKLASQRLKEALTEIKTVARVDPLIAADGAIALMEKIWSALAHVDSSSGALGNAVNKTVRELVDIVVAAPAEEKLRERWLERMWTAVEDEGCERRGISRSRIHASPCKLLSRRCAGWPRAGATSFVPGMSGMHADNPRRTASG